MEVTEPGSESGSPVPMTSESESESEPGSELTPMTSESESEPELGPMDVGIQPVKVDGRPAAVYIVQAHSIMQPEVEELPEAVQRMYQPLSDTGIRYVNLVRPGAPCWVSFDPKVMFGPIDQYIDEDNNFNLGGFSHELSSSVSISGTDQGHVSQATTLPSNPPAFLQFWNHGTAAPAQMQGLWNLSEIIQNRNATPLSQSQFLGIPLPNVNDLSSGSLKNGREFATTLIGMINQAFESGPGLPRFTNNPELLESTINPIKEDVIQILTDAGPDYRATLSLSFVSYLLAAMTPVGVDIYIIINACRDVRGVTIDQIQGAVNTRTLPAVTEDVLARVAGINIDNPNAIDPMECVEGRDEGVPRPQVQWCVRGPSLPPPPPVARAAPLPPPPPRPWAAVAAPPPRAWAAPELLEDLRKKLDEQSKRVRELKSLISHWGDTPDLQQRLTEEIRKLDIIGQRYNNEIARLNGAGGGAPPWLGGGMGAKNKKTHKTKGKGKTKCKGKTKSKGRGKTKSKGRGKGNTKGKGKSKGNTKSKGKGRGKGKTKGKGRAKGKGKGKRKTMRNRN